MGYHIIKVTDIKPARELSLNEVKDLIGNQLATEKKKEAVARFIKQTKDRADIQILEEFPQGKKAAQ